MTTKSQNVANDLVALLRARNSLVWIVTREEARVERYLFEASGTAGYFPHIWDVAQGVTSMNGKVDPTFQNTNDPSAVLSAIQRLATNGTGRGVWILRDLPAWLGGMPGAATVRQVRNLARMLPTTPRESAQAMVILTPSSDVPPELTGHATVIEWPLPDREEIAAILDAAIESLPDGLQADAAPNGQRDAAIDAAVGLSGEEAQSCYARSLVQTKRIDPAMVASEKKRIFAKEKVIEYYDPIPGGLESVGGLENLKAWLTARKQAYSPAAREYGLPTPKGAILVGVPGCGKSLTAKAIATAWGVPLLKLDLGTLKSKFVGESEDNLRRAFKTIEAVGRCVVWLDEIEKSLQGATSGSADGGVSSDALGAVLSWMQERQGAAFVIATANDVEGLPPELLRKGRFDEVFWVDLPNAQERESILAATLRNHGRKAELVQDNASKIAMACEGFTGSEIAAIVPDALFTAFADGAREINTADLLQAASLVVPLSKTAKEKIEKLREWSVGRARPATLADTTQERVTKKIVRALDL